MTPSILIPARPLVLPALLLLVLFAPLAAIAHTGELLPGEATLARNMQDLLTPGFLPLFQALHLLGQRWVVVTYGTVAVALLWAFRYRREALFLLAGLLSVQSNGVLKELIGRARPDGAALNAYAIVGGDYGFPSGDAQLFATFFGLLFLLMPALVRGRWSVAGRTLCGIMLLAVGPARVALGVHWPSDTVGGYVLGGSIAWVLYALYREGNRKDAVRSVDYPAASSDQA